ncbi:hypothetical protein UlMin_042577 [Ulmus minor]
MFYEVEKTSDDLFQIIPPLTCKDQNEMEGEDQNPPPTPSQDHHKPPAISQRRGRSSVTFDENPSEKKKKKVVHREIERQRRQEMATLYSSLRSILPFQYLKGKRSISDHTNEAVSYIKDLQKKIQDLSEKKDKLKELVDHSNCSSSSIALPNLQPQIYEDSISVRHCREEVEVVVNTAFKQGLSLARVVRVLVGEGLSVVNCVSARVNERLLHTVHSEVNGGRRVDPCELEQKLKNLCDLNVEQKH